MEVCILNYRRTAVHICDKYSFSLNALCNYVLCFAYYSICRFARVKSNERGDLH